MFGTPRALAIVTVLVLTAIGVIPAADATVEPTTSPVASFSVTFVDTSRPAGTINPARELPTSIFYPTNKAGFFKTNPLIVIAHGFGGSGPLMANVARQLASYGYVVAAPTFPLTNFGTPGGMQFGDYVNQPADMSFVITKMLELNEDKSSPVYHRMTRRDIGVAGHSLGAVTVLGFQNTCCDDPRIDAVVPISGAALPFPGGSFFTSTPEPMMLIHGDADPIAPYVLSQNAYNDGPAPKFLVTLLGLGHSPFRYGDTFPGAVPPPEVVTVNTAVTFFDLYLNNGARGVRFIRDAADAPGVATLQEALK